MKIRRDNRIFIPRPLKRRSFWEWLFNRCIPENAIVELTNAIVDAGRPSAVSGQIVRRIHARYRFNIYERFSPEIAKLYLAFVRRVFSKLAGTELTQEEVDDIAAIQEIFQIPAETIARLNHKAGSEIYLLALKAALADSILTQKEKEDILHLGRQLDLDGDTMHTLYNQALCSLVQKKVEDALVDGELSPEEEADIKATCERFDIDLSYKETTDLAMRRGRRIWQLRHAPLQPIGVDIQLKRGENCYAQFDVLWLEVRRSAAMPWTPGYLRVSDKSEIALSYAPIVEDCLTEIDAGQLFLTDRRLIFVGKGTTTTIPLSKILRIEQFREGIKVHKETGRSPYLVSQQALPLGVLAARLLAEASCAENSRPSQQVSNA